MNNKKSDASLFGLLVCRRTSVLNGKPCDEAEEVPFFCVYHQRNEKRWMVRIADGAALQEFCDKYGDIILSMNTAGADPCYEVEIYDDEREQ